MTNVAVMHLRRANVSVMNYWIALYKQTATINSTTLWFDSNPSTFRVWSPGQPDEIYRCFAYDADGFLDTDCNSINLFMCKKEG